MGALKAFIRKLVPVLCAAAVVQPTLWAQNIPAGVTEFTEPGKAFKEYQAYPPPIKHILYEQSYANGKYGPGIVLADGSIQPGGFFTRHLTNSPYTTGILVDGESSTGEWEYFAENLAISYGPKTCYTNFSSSAIFPGFLKLQTVARLGLPRPFPEHDGFVWTSQTQFRFIGPWDTYEGAILKFDERGRTAEIEYHSSRKDAKVPTKCRIAYKYDSTQDFPPAQFVVDLAIGETHTIATNIIHDLATGTDEHAERGFSLEEFVPETAKAGQIFYISNHIRYTPQADHTLVEYKYPDAIERRQHERSPHPVRHAILFVFVAVPIVTVFFWVRRRGAS